MSTPPQNPPRWKAWLRRMGWAGFLFFLIKGLVWLAIGYFGVQLFD